MISVITAGGIPQPGESLYEFTLGGYKALLDIAGKPMVQWILDAMDQAQRVDQIVLVGLQPDCGVSSLKPLHFVADHGSMLENVRAGMAKALLISPDTHHSLIVSSDIPGITAEMVDWVVDTCLQTDHDLYYNVIPRPAMEERFPNSRRTYVKLKGMELTGGDMNMIRAQTLASHEDLWKKLIDARKNPLKQASLIGFDTLLMILFHTITLEDAERIASQRLGLKGRAIVCPFAEVGMDVDKDNQFEIMRDYLTRKKKG